MTKREDKKSQKEKMRLIGEALKDEMTRFNEAVKGGKIARLQTFTKIQEVAHVTHDFRYYCPKDNGGFGFHYFGCNDHVWADLLAQVGVSRNALWSAYTKAQ